MVTRLLYTTFVRIFARRLAEDAYDGILRRPPDDAGLQAHVRRIQRTGDLSGVLHEISHSDEARRQLTQMQAEALARQLVRGLTALEGPLGAALTGQAAATISRSADIAASLVDIARSEEALACMLRRHAAFIANEVARGLPEDARAGAEAVQQCRDALAQGAPLHEAVASMVRVEADWGHVLRRHAEAIVVSAFHGLLLKPADAPEIGRHAADLRATADLAGVLNEILSMNGGPQSQSEPMGLTWSPEDVVRAIFRALLDREPESTALEGYAKSLLESGDLSALLSEVSRSKEHKRQVLLRSI